MAVKFRCAWGKNSVADGVEVTTNTAPVSVQSAIFRPGSSGYAAEITGGNGFFRQQIYTTNQTLIGYNSVAIYIKSLPNATTQLVRFSNVSNALSGVISMATDGTLLLLKASGAQIGSASAALVTNAWYVVQLKNDASGAGALEGRYKKDGDTAWTTFATGANSAAGTWGRVLIGTITGAQTTCDILFTDWKVNDSSGSDNTGYPDDGRLKYGVPSAAGETTQWTPDTGSNFARVNEVTPDDATSLVAASILNKEDLYSMPAWGLKASDVVSSVVVGVRHANDTADATTSFKVELEKVSGGTKAQSAAIIPNSVTWTTNSTQAARADTYPLVCANDPDGAAWNAAGGGTLDTMRPGILLSAANVNKIQITSIWVIVDYVPGPVQGIKMISQAIQRASVY